jgi:LCP family protein required for cell wall assembly
MRIYTAGKPPKKRRRWLRVVLWTMLVLGVAAAAGAGALYYWVQGAVDKITTPVTPQEKGAAALLKQVTSTPGVTLASTPITMLIVGYDTRPGQSDNSSNTDTMELVRLDPARHAAAMLSIPRDWLVDIPGYGTGMVNSAWARGGAPLLIETLKNALGIVPNYYVPVNFSAFIDTVNAFGGVWLDIDHRYYSNDPTIMTVNVQPGYQKLGGWPALTYVRWRHTDNDNVYRVARQQDFMREFKREIDPLGAASNILDLVNTAEKNIRIIGATGHRMTLDQIIGYLNVLRGMPSGSIVNVRMSGYADPSNPNRVLIDQSEISQDVAQLMHPDPTLALRAALNTVGAAAVSQAANPAFDRAKTVVEVRNGNGTAGAASSAAYELTQAGWPLASSNGNADSLSYFNSVVYYGTKPGSKQAAAALAQLLQPASTKPLTASVVAALGQSRPVVADVVAVIGQTFDTIAQSSIPLAPLPADQAVPFTNDSSRDLSQWQTIRRQSRLPLMYPTRLPTGTVTGDPVVPSYPAFRLYDTGGYRALNVTYYLPNDPAKTTFDLQTITWSDPPILQGVTRTQTTHAITYSLYYDGGHLHRIAWHYHGTTFWLSNSLVDGLSNSTMWRIAIGIRPVP